jgi:hypothetical protein
MFIAYVVVTVLAAADWRSCSSCWPWLWRDRKSKPIYGLIGNYQKRTEGLRYEQGRDPLSSPQTLPVPPCEG